MRVRLLVIVAVGLAAWSSFDRDGRAGTLKLIRSIDQPLPTQLGLDIAWDGEHLWTLTFRENVLPGQSDVVIHQVDPSDGSVVSWADVHDGNFSALAWDGSALWTTAYNAVRKRLSDGTYSDSFLLPLDSTTRLRGAAWDGASLWVSDAGQHRILEVDLASQSVMSSFSAPGLEARGLAWDGDSLWLVDGADGLIFQMDTSGNVLETWTSPAIDPYGITFDGEYLWVSDNALVSDPPRLHTRRIHQLAIPEPSTLGLLCSAILCLAFLTYSKGDRVMKTRLLLIVVVALVGWSTSGQTARAGTLQLVHSIDLPFEPGAGGATDLTWDGEHVWAATSDLLWGFRTYEFDPSDGSVVSWFYTEPANAFGLAWDGDSLWNTVWQGNGPHPIPPSEDFIERRATDGSLLKRLDAPHSPFGYPAGATWDGTYLWVSDAQWQQLIQVDPTDGHIIKTLSFPPRDPRGLAWDGVSLWVVSGADNLIYQMDTSGNVLDTWLSPAIHPYGITFDGQYLWVSDSGTGTSQILQLAIPEPSTLTLLAGTVVSLAYLSFRQRKRFAQAKYRRMC